MPGPNQAGFGSASGPPYADGYPGTSLRDFSQFVAQATLANGVIGETIPRWGISSAAQAIATTGVIYLQALALTANQTVGHLAFMTGTTAASTPTHFWMCLCDFNRNMLAVTADNTTGAMGASTAFDFAIANINNEPFTPASGTIVAGTSFLVPYTGLYYIGILSAGTTIPTSQGATTTAVASGAVPILGGSSSTGSLTAPPTVATQFGTLTAGTSQIWAAACA